MRSRSVRGGLRIALFAAALILLWLALRTVSLANIWSVLSNLTVNELLLLALLNLGVLLTMSARWRVFLSAQGFTLSLFRLTGYRLAGFGVSYFTPGPHFGGEPLQVYLVSSRSRVPYDASITAVALDKIVEMVANFTFLAAGLLLVTQQLALPQLNGQRLWPYAIALLILPTALIIALWRGHHPLTGALLALNTLWPSARQETGSHQLFPRLLDAVRRTVYDSETRAISLFQTQPRVLLTAAAISVFSWIAMVIEFWAMTEVLELNLSLTQALGIMLAARVAILMPIPAALGALEFSLATASSALGLPPEAGISLAILIRTRDVLLGLLGLWIGGASIWRRPATSERDLDVVVPHGREAPRPAE